MVKHLPEVDGNVVVTSVKVILKFGYDQINISYGNALLKNMPNPVSLVTITKHNKIKCPSFHHKWWNIVLKLGSIVKVTLAKIIL